MNEIPLTYEGRKGLQEFQQKSAEVPRSPVEQPQKEKQEQDANPLTRAEVQGLINSLVESIVKGFAQKGDIDRIARGFEIARQELKRNVPTKKQIIEWATEVVPPSLRGLNSDPTRKTGDTLKLVSGYPVGLDKGMWMPDISGLSAKGNKVLYRTIILREYDADGVIVEIGHEINPDEFESQTAYEAALAAIKHTLQPTYDYFRWI